MIEYIKFTDLNKVSESYIPNVKAIKRRLNKEIRFKNGINILLAPNGTGKTTIINTIAKYHFCYNTGTVFIDKETIFDVSIYNLMGDDFDDYPYKPKDGIEMSSDGNVCYVSPRSYNGVADLDHTFMTAKDFATSLFDRDRSAGETNKSNFIRIYNKVKDIDMNEYRKVAVESFFEDKYRNDRYGKCKNTVFKYICNPNLEPSKPTMLIDELDSNMDIINSINLMKSINYISQKFQIIMATHNPLVLEMPNVNIIELKRFYKRDCLNELESFHRINNALKKEKAMYDAKVAAKNANKKKVSEKIKDIIARKVPSYA